MNPVVANLFQSHEQMQQQHQHHQQHPHQPPPNPPHQMHPHPQMGGPPPPFHPQQQMYMQQQPMPPLPPLSFMPQPGPSSHPHMQPQHMQQMQQMQPPPHFPPMPQMPPPGNAYHVPQQQQPPPKPFPIVAPSPMLPHPMPLHPNHYAATTQQVSGPGSALTANAAAEEEVTAAVGLVLSPFTRLSISESPQSKLLGGEEHTATPCVEFSSFPREADAAFGSLIAHAHGITLFALKSGLVRLVYGDSDDKQLEVLKGVHTTNVLEVAFFPTKSNAATNVVYAATLSASEIGVWKFEKSSGSNKLTFSLHAKVTGSAFYRMRFQPVALQYVAVIHRDGGLSLLDIEDVLRSGVNSDGEQWEKLDVSGVSDVTWSNSGMELRIAATSNGNQADLFEYSLTRDAVQLVGKFPSSRVNRIISIPNSSFLLLAYDDYTQISVWNPLRSIAVSSISFDALAVDLSFGGVELDPSGSFVALAYKSIEGSGEKHDQGFFVMHISAHITPIDTRVFDFITVFFQPSHIVSFSIAAATSASADEFSLFAVENKPIVRLTIALQSVYRPLTAEEQRHITRQLLSSVDASASSTSSASSEVVDLDAAGRERGPDLPSEPISRASSGLSQSAMVGSFDTVPSRLLDDDEEELEADDAVPALRSSLPKLLLGQGAQSDTSPPAAAAPSSTLQFDGSLSNSSSAPNSRLQSPGVFKGERPEFQMDASLDMSAAADYHSGRSSPVSSTSPTKQPTLRPRSTSVENRNVAFNLPSSQPTPSSTPAPPGTPNLSTLKYASSASGLSQPSSEVGSPVPSPRGSPRGPTVVANGMSEPPSPFRQTSVATTADGSAQQSPLISSPSSPLISSSPTPNPQLDESGLRTIPSTPTQAASSTTTPAPTPLALNATGSVRLSQMSATDVSLHFLSAGVSDTSSHSRANSTAAPNNTPLNTPAPTPANSVPSTPRLAATPSGSRKTSTIVGVGHLTSQIPAAGNLRVRTQSGSTSPSPISSPLITGNSGYIKARSASMDRSGFLEPPVDEGEEQSPHSTLTAHNESKTPAPSPMPGAAVPRRDVNSKEKQEQSLMIRLDQLFSRHFGKLTGVVASERMENQQSERARVEQLTSGLTQQIAHAVNDALVTVVERAMEDTINDTLLPSIEQSIAHALHGNTAGTSASSSTGGVASGASFSTDQLTASFRAAFTQTLLPSFENSTKAMLNQVQKSVESAASSAATAAATSAKTLAVDQTAARDAKKRAEEEDKRRAMERNESVQKEKQRDAELKAMTQQMSEMHKLVQALTAAQVQSTAANQAMQQQLKDLTALVAARPATVVSAAPHASVSAVPPPPAAAAAPVAADPIAEVSALLVQERFDAAFTRALSSGKLATVMFVLKQLEPRTLLSTTVAAHKLSAPVLLSLIQQLSVDLAIGSDASVTELKLKLLWLRESVMVLQPTDPVLAAHVKPILRELLNKLESKPFAELPPTSPFFDDIRLIKMVCSTKLAVV